MEPFKPPREMSKDEYLAYIIGQNLSKYNQARGINPGAENEPFRRQFLEGAMNQIPQASSQEALQQYFPAIQELIKSGGTNFSPGLQQSATDWDAKEKARKKAAIKAKEQSKQPAKKSPERPAGG